MNAIATFTDFLRRPKDVVAKAGDGAVRITRRDAEDLILMRAGDLDRQHDGIALASRIMRATARHPGDMAATVRDVFGWVGALSEDEQAEFADEVDGLVWCAAELGEYTQLLRCILSWQGTAEAYAAGLPRDNADLSWLDDAPSVPRP
ncbi:hypothetical protein B5P44_00695 [Mycobacterium sp. CBMA 213]|uniref:Prevent-host-death protein n=1 Tax=Mycolicibacterium sp. CBMA 213 TaxID=1968788 RepID=A0A343VRC3_9MYCO|nr:MULTISPECIES: hypothetical protein [unclassified Mycolicibacterium]AVN58447.1 hypothetical protein B5P44_p00152 [Mycolicibacterium sp. CBMA 213]MUL61104.1 hypothetical protein [Mycolicibacterium sp. CBMA 335]MUM03341.1 hypothetical protein [Mycolicibacterium sp. CBMA 213]